MIITILPRNLLALLLINCIAFLGRDQFKLLSWNVLTLLLGCVLCQLFVLSFAIPCVLCSTFFLGHFLTVFLWHLITNLVLLVVAVLPRNSSLHRLLHIMTFADWNRSANWFVHIITNFLGFILCVGNRLVLAILSWNLLTVFLGDLLTDLSWLIPALLLSIYVGTFFLSDSLSSLFVDIVAQLLIFCRTVLVIFSIALLLLFVLGYRVLLTATLHLRHIVTLFLSF